MGNEKKRFGGKSGCCVAMQVIQMLSTELEQADNGIRSMGRYGVFTYTFTIQNQQNVGNHNLDLP